MHIFKCGFKRGFNRIYTHNTAVMVGVFILFVLFFLFSDSEVKAGLTMSIQSISLDTVSSNEQEVTVTASISGLPNPSFFRIAWQKSSGDNYFGYVQNNSGEWVKIQSGQDCTKYFSVTDTGTSSLVLVTKIGSDNSPDNGNYTLKLRRYTSSCGSESDSGPIAITINFPTPEPTQSPSPTNPPTSAPTQAPTQAPTRAPTASPTPQRTKSPTPKPTSTPQVLGESETPPPADSLTLSDSLESSSPAPTAPADSKKTNSNFPLIALAFIISGIGLMGAAGYMAYKKQKENSSATISE